MMNGRATSSISEQVAQRPKGSPQTPGIWLLSSLPFMTLGLSGISTLLVIATGNPLLTYAGTPVALGLAWFFALLDAQELEQRGWRRSSVLWMLLFPPLVYLIVRGRSIRTQGGRAWPSELVYLAGIALIVSYAVLSAISAATLASQSQSPSTDQQTQENQQPAPGEASTNVPWDEAMGGYDLGLVSDNSRLALVLLLNAGVQNASVDCSGPPEEDSVIGTTTTCTLTDAIGSFPVDILVRDDGEAFLLVADGGSSGDSGDGGSGSGDDGLSA
jgi:hypothetical protein